MASAELEIFIDQTIKVAQANGYHPTIFIDMRARHGTLSAISRLVENGDVQSGFRRLEKLGLLDHTIEAAVTKFPREFSPATLECAEFRLRMAKN